MPVKAACAHVGKLGVGVFRGGKQPIRRAVMRALLVGYLTNPAALFFKKRNIPRFAEVDDLFLCAGVTRIDRMRRSAVDNGFAGFGNDNAVERIRVGGTMVIERRTALRFGCRRGFFLQMVAKIDSG